MNFGDYFTNISGNGFNQEAFKLRGDEEWSVFNTYAYILYKYKSLIFIMERHQALERLN